MPLPLSAPRKKQNHGSVDPIVPWQFFSQRHRQGLHFWPWVRHSFRLQANNQQLNVRALSPHSMRNLHGRLRKMKPMTGKVFLRTLFHLSVHILIRTLWSQLYMEAKTLPSIHWPSQQGHLTAATHLQLCLTTWTPTNRRKHSIASWKCWTTRLAVDIVLTLTSKQKQNQQTKQATEQVETYSTEKLASKAKQSNKANKQASKHLQQQYTPYVCTTGNYRASVSICSSSFKNSLCL